MTLDETVEHFPEEVKYLSDIPGSWFYVVLQKKAKVPIALDIISHWSKKGKKPFTQSIAYLMGLSK